jgi:hypothetical protein
VGDGKENRLDFGDLAGGGVLGGSRALRGFEQRDGDDGAYEGVAENVDLRNLNLNVVIPLFELKGRNGLDYPVVAAYCNPSV